MKKRELKNVDGVEECEKWPKLQNTKNAYCNNGKVDVWQCNKILALLNSGYDLSNYERVSTVMVALPTLVGALYHRRMNLLPYDPKNLPLAIFILDTLAQCC